MLVLDRAIRPASGALSGDGYDPAAILAYLRARVSRLTIVDGKALIARCGGAKALNAALLGAAFLILCDTLARTAFAPHELPVGIPVSILGAPFFLWLLLRERRRHHA
jgi:iron complex transport system permease protein